MAGGQEEIFGQEEETTNGTIESGNDNTTNTFDEVEFGKKWMSEHSEEYNNANTLFAERMNNEFVDYINSTPEMIKLSGANITVNVNLNGSYNLNIFSPTDLQYDIFNDLRELAMVWVNALNNEVYGKINEQYEKDKAKAIADSNRNSGGSINDANTDNISSSTNVSGFNVNDFNEKWYASHKNEYDEAEKDVRESIYNNLRGYVSSQEEAIRLDDKITLTIEKNGTWCLFAGTLDKNQSDDYESLFNKIQNWVNDIGEGIYHDLNEEYAKAKKEAEEAYNKEHGGDNNSQSETNETEESGTSGSSTTNDNQTSSNNGGASSSSNDTNNKDNKTEDEKSSAEKEYNSNHFIKKSVRNAIKKMAFMSQIAECISVMPKPEDFATEVVSEVIVMMGKIKNFSKRINETIETYSSFPTNYLTESASLLTSSIDYVTKMPLDAIDNVRKATDVISDLTNIKIGDDEYGWKESKEYLDKVTNFENGVKEDIDNYKNKINDKIGVAVEYINKIMNNINNSMNTTFADFQLPTNEDGSIKNNQVTNKLSGIKDEYNDGSMAGDLITSTTDMLSTVIANFNIGKISKGIVGMATNIALLETGLDKLPMLNMDEILAFGKAKFDKIDKKISEQHTFASEEVRLYKESDEYKKIVEECEGDKQKLRESIRKKRKQSIKEIRKTQNDLSEEEKRRKKEEKNNQKSVANELRKKKESAKKAKRAQKYLDMLKIEIKNFSRIFKDFGNHISDEWNLMMSQYKESVKEIKDYFTGKPENSPGSKYIDDCCDAIEDDCKKIKETCKNLIPSITAAVSDIAMPDSIGPVFPNPGHKVLVWINVSKTIFNEIRRLISYGIDIFKQVNNLATIILNGLKSLKEIKDSLIELLNIKWLIDFIDKIIDLFSSKCKEGKELLENTISPIYYDETDDYDNEFELLEKLANRESINRSSISIKNYKSTLDRKKKDINTITLALDSDGKFNGSQDDLDEAFDILEDKGENLIVAYKSPIMNEDGSDFIGWIFYYSNVDSHYNGKMKKRMNRRIMKRAVKTSRRKNGGKNMLLKRNVTKTNNNTPYVIDGIKRYGKVKAFDAYYWYTKWTTDPTDDDVDTNNNNTDVVSPVMTTENGTLVKLEDGRRVFVNEFGVRPGDYVLVEGKRYRVQ